MIYPTDVPHCHDVITALHKQYLDQCTRAAAAETQRDAAVADVRELSQKVGDLEAHARKRADLVDDLEAAEFRYDRFDDSPEHPAEPDGIDGVIASMLDQGLPLRMIAEQVGLSQSTVANRVRELRGQTDTDDPIEIEANAFGEGGRQ